MSVQLKISISIIQIKKRRRLRKEEKIEKITKEIEDVESKLEDVRLEIERVKIQIEEYNKESKKAIEEIYKSIL